MNCVITIYRKTREKTTTATWTFENPTMQ